VLHFLGDEDQPVGQNLAANIAVFVHLVIFSHSLDAAAVPDVSHSHQKLYGRPMVLLRSTAINWTHR
jgi:hypothetical protein